MGAPGRRSGAGGTGAPGGGLGRRSWGCANASVHRLPPANNATSNPNLVRCLEFMSYTSNPLYGNDCHFGVPS